MQYAKNTATLVNTFGDGGVTTWNIKYHSEEIKPLAVGQIFKIQDILTILLIGMISIYLPA